MSVFVTKTIHIFVAKAGQSSPRTLKPFWSIQINLYPSWNKQIYGMILYITIIVACCPHLVRSIDTSQLTEACSHIVTQPFSVLFPVNNVKYLQKFTLAKRSFLLPFVSWESRWPEIPVGIKYSHASCLSSFIRMEFDLGREYFFFLLLARCFIYILWYTWWKLCSVFFPCPSCNCFSPSNPF